MINWMFELLTVILPYIIIFGFIIILLDLLKHLKFSLTNRQSKTNLKPVNLRIHAKPITKQGLTASKDYSLSKPTILGIENNNVSWEEVKSYFNDLDDEPIHYKVLLNCPNCNAEIVDFDAFFCASCGYQIKAPKVEWIE